MPDYDDEFEPVQPSINEVLEQLRFLAASWLSRGWSPGDQRLMVDLFCHLDDHLTDGGVMPDAWSQRSLFVELRDWYSKPGRSMVTVELPQAAESDDAAPVRPAHPITPALPPSTAGSKSRSRDGSGTRENERKAL